MASALADEPVDTDATDDEPLTESEYETYLPDIDGDVWDVIDELAEDAWHHPDISLQWGEVGVELWTHDVDGLQKPDFVMAAKMDRIYDDYD